MCGNRNHRVGLPFSLLSRGLWTPPSASAVSARRRRRRREERCPRGARPAWRGAGGEQAEARVRGWGAGAPSWGPPGPLCDLVAGPAGCGAERGLVYSFSACPANCCTPFVCQVWPQALQTRNTPTPRHGSGEVPRPGRRGSGPAGVGTQGPAGVGGVEGMQDRGRGVGGDSVVEARGGGSGRRDPGAAPHGVPPGHSAGSH